MLRGTSHSVQALSACRPSDALRCSSSIVISPPTRNRDIGSMLSECRWVERPRVVCVSCTVLRLTSYVGVCLTPSLGLQGTTRALAHVLTDPASTAWSRSHLVPCSPWRVPASPLLWLLHTHLRLPDMLSDRLPASCLSLCRSIATAIVFVTVFMRGNPQPEPASTRRRTCSCC